LGIEVITANQIASKEEWADIADALETRGSQVYAYSKLNALLRKLQSNDELVVQVNGSTKSIKSREQLFEFLELPDPLIAPIKPHLSSTSAPTGVIIPEEDRHNVVHALGTASGHKSGQRKLTELLNQLEKQGELIFQWGYSSIVVTSREQLLELLQTRDPSPSYQSLETSGVLNSDIPPVARSTSVDKLEKIKTTLLARSENRKNPNDETLKNGNTQSFRVLRIIGQILRLIVSR